jgi:pimeloyl-ACP methyl ester carboxylesterase
LRERLLSTGYATLIWDKPGWGASRGEFGKGRVQSERAAILLDAINILRANPVIDSNRIGVWGVSQAGYVVSLALERCAPVGFAVLVGAPGENGVHQTAYFVGQQVLCAGAALAGAAEAESLACGVLSAQRYEKYAAFGRRLLERHPLVKEIDFMAGILPVDRWAAREPGDEAYYDPVVVFKHKVVPVLVLYGELDKNVDPEQGAAAFRNAFASAGNDRSRVVVLPNLDHDMVQAETGCMEERNQRRSWPPSPAYLDTLIKWLREVCPRR